MSRFPAWWYGTTHPASWRPRTLRQKQTLFLACIQRLNAYATAHGWELTPSDFAVNEDRIRYALAPGSSEERVRNAVGHRLGGCHSMKLAGDVNLFIRGRIRTKHCPEWDGLGAKWKSLNPLCRWGGDFDSGDYNHFSITHRGRA